MAKITAFQGDRLTEYLVIPDSVDLEQVKREYNEWYRGYKWETHKGKDFKTLIQWLIERGAREPDESELVIEER